MTFFKHIPRTKNREYYGIAEWNGDCWVARMLDYKASETGATPREAFRKLHKTWLLMKKACAVLNTYPYTRPELPLDADYKIWWKLHRRANRIKCGFVIAAILLTALIWLLNV